MADLSINHFDASPQSAISESPPAGAAASPQAVPLYAPVTEVLPGFTAFPTHTVPVERVEFFARDAVDRFLDDNDPESLSQYAAPLFFVPPPALFLRSLCVPCELGLQYSAARALSRFVREQREAEVAAAGPRVSTKCKAYVRPVRVKLVGRSGNSHEVTLPRVPFASSTRPGILDCLLPCALIAACNYFWEPWFCGVFGCGNGCAQSFIRSEIQKSVGVADGTLSGYVGRPSRFCRPSRSVQELSPLHLKGRRVRREAAKAGAARRGRVAVNSDEDSDDDKLMVEAVDAAVAERGSASFVGGSEYARRRAAAGAAVGREAGGSFLVPTTGDTPGVAGSRIVRTTVVTDGRVVTTTTAAGRASMVGVPRADALTLQGAAEEAAVDAARHGEDRAAFAARNARALSPIGIVYCLIEGFLGGHFPCCFVTPQTHIELALFGFDPWPNSSPNRKGDIPKRKAPLVAPSERPVVPPGPIKQSQHMREFDLMRLRRIRRPVEVLGLPRAAPAGARQVIAHPVSGGYDGSVLAAARAIAADGPPPSGWVPVGPTLPAAAVAVGAAVAAASAAPPAGVHDVLPSDATAACVARTADDYAARDYVSVADAGVPPPPPPEAAPCADGVWVAPTGGGGSLYGGTPGGVSVSPTAAAAQSTTAPPAAAAPHHPSAHIQSTDLPAAGPTRAPPPAAWPAVAAGVSAAPAPVAPTTVPPLPGAAGAQSPTAPATAAAQVLPPSPASSAVGLVRAVDAAACLPQAAAVDSIYGTAGLLAATDTAVAPPAAATSPSVMFTPMDASPRGVAAAWRDDAPSPDTAARAAAAAAAATPQATAAIAPHVTFSPLASPLPAPTRPTRMVTPHGPGPAAHELPASQYAAEGSPHALVASQPAAAAWRRLAAKVTTGAARVSVLDAAALQSADGVATRRAAHPPPYLSQVADGPDLAAASQSDGPTVPTPIRPQRQARPDADGVLVAVPPAAAQAQHASTPWGGWGSSPTVAPGGPTTGQAHGAAPAALLRRTPSVYSPEPVLHDALVDSAGAVTHPPAGARDMSAALAAGWPGVHTAAPVHTAAAPDAWVDEGTHVAPSSRHVDVVGGAGGAHDHWELRGSEWVHPPMKRHRLEHQQVEQEAQQRLYDEQQLRYQQQRVQQMEDALPRKYVVRSTSGHIGMPQSLPPVSVAHEPAVVAMDDVVAFPQAALQLAALGARFVPTVTDVASVPSPAHSGAITQPFAHPVASPGGGYASLSAVADPMSTAVGSRASNNDAADWRLAPSQTQDADDYGGWMLQ